MKITEPLRRLEIGHKLTYPLDALRSIRTTKKRLQDADLGLWKVEMMSDKIRVTRLNLPLTDLQTYSLDSYFSELANESLPGTEQIRVQETLENMEIDAIISLDWSIKKHSYIDMPDEYDTKLNDFDTVGTVDVYDPIYNSTITHQKI